MPRHSSSRSCLHRVRPVFVDEEIGDDEPECTLPREVWCMVAEYLSPWPAPDALNNTFHLCSAPGDLPFDPRDLFRLRAVCKQTREGVSYLSRLWLADDRITDKVLRNLVPLFPLLQKMIVGNRQKAKITSDGIRALSDFPVLEELYIVGYHAQRASGEDHLAPNMYDMLVALRDGRVHQCRGSTPAAPHRALRSLTHLRILDISSCFGLTDTILIRGLSKLVNLESLLLHSAVAGNAGLASLKGMSQLRHLALTKCSKFGDAGLLQILPGMKFLEKLQLGSTLVSNAGLVGLKDSTRLQMLNLQGCRNIRNVGLSDSISGLTSLQSLCLAGTNIGDAELKDLTRLVNLRNLSLGGTRLTCIGVCELLPRLLLLEELSLSGTRVADRGMASLRVLVNLRTLNMLGCTDVTDAGVRVGLADMRELEKLNLSLIRVQDEGLATLSCLPKLYSLALSGCSSITNAGVSRHLVRMTGLKNLELAGTRVGDSGVAALARNLRGLRQLDLSACPEITAVSLPHLSTLVDRGLECFSISKTELRNSRPLLHVLSAKNEFVSNFLNDQ